MKTFLGVDETPPRLERSFKATTRRRSELQMDIEMEIIPQEKLSSLAENINIKTREASKNTDLDMQEFLGINNALQSIQGELLYNTSKLTDISKSIKRDTKKLEEVEAYPTYSEEQKQLHKDRLDDLNTEKQARLEKLSKTEKISKRKSQGLSKLLKRFLIKMHL